MSTLDPHNIQKGGWQAPLPLQLQTVSQPFLSPSFWASAVFGTLVSIAISGFVFPFGNNAFHLPIVGELYNAPGFAADPFIQSLRNFSSGLWMVLAGSADWIEPRFVFLAGFFLSRLTCLLGFLACADHLGVLEARHRFLFALVASVSPLMRGESYAGGGGLFIPYFTHSEITNGLFLLAVWTCLRAEFGRALALCGLTFFINAFVGVWLGFVLLMFFLREIWLGRMTLLPPKSSLLLGLLVGCGFVAPVLINIVQNPDFGASLDFDYLGFLTEYWPFHFLIWSIPVGEIAHLALVAAIGAAALFRLPDEEGRTRAVFAACVILYGIGIVTPWITDAPLVLNLHLLRSGTLLHLLSALFLSAVAVRWWFGAEPADRVAAPFLVAMLSLVTIAPRGNRVMLLSVFAVIALSPVYVARLTPGGFVQFLNRHRRPLSSCVGAFVVLAATLSSYKSQNVMADIKAGASSWSEVGKWAAKKTEIGSVFLVAGEASPDFELLSGRSVWVDWKRGAAVMWSPSYYKTWKERRDAVSKLVTIEEKMNYARANGISYLIETDVSGCVEAVVYRLDDLCVVKVD